jgi:hypothetical protein
VLLAEDENRVGNTVTGRLDRDIGIPVEVDTSGLNESATVLISPPQ